MRPSLNQIAELQSESLKRVDEFMAKAMDTGDARDAANWSLAAKNAVSVAVSCETIPKVRAEGERRR